MSVSEKIRELILQIGAQRDDIRVTLKILRIQLAKIDLEIQAIDDMLAHGRMIEDIDILHAEFVSLKETATKIYIDAAKDFNSRIKARL